MAPITLNQLTLIIEKQDARIAQLQGEIEKLKSWSDLNDHYLQEMIDAQGSTLDRLLQVINEMHEADKIHERMAELEAEESAPVAQLLREFVEKNATKDELDELEGRK